MKKYPLIIILLVFPFLFVYGQGRDIEGSDPCSVTTETISCNSTIKGNTKASSDRIGESFYDNKGCSVAGDFTGKDIVYELDQVPNNAVVTIQLNANTDLDLFVISCSNSSGTCLGASTSPDGTEGIVVNWQSNYRLVVDGYNPDQDGPFELTVSSPNCGGSISVGGSSPCALPAEWISCNSTLFGDTDNGSNRVGSDFYKSSGCLSSSQAASHPFTGNDVVYKLEDHLPAETPVTISLETYNNSKDISFFVFSCLGSGSCVASSIAAGGKETLTIKWRSHYRIIVDAPDPSENGAYKLSVSCNQCGQAIDQNCGAVSYAYVGEEGSLKYQFSATNDLPSDGDWVAWRSNGLKFSLGSGRTKTAIFDAAGTYTVCYTYEDADDCDVQCCKQVVAQNPDNCNSITSSESASNFTLTLSGISSSNVLRWVDGDNRVVGTSSRKLTVPIPKPETCEKYCVYYYHSGSNSYKFCCTEVCGPECDTDTEEDCSLLSYDYSGSDGKLKFDFSVPSTIADGGIWTSQSQGGPTFEIGEGQSISHTFFAATNYTICYTYEGEDGCPDVCCKQIKIDDPYDCDRIILLQSPNNYTLALTGVSNSDVVKWVDESTNRLIATGARKVTIPIPDPNTCKYYRAFYYHSSSYQVCSFQVCGTDNGGAPVDTPEDPMEEEEEEMEEEEEETNIACCPNEATTLNHLIEVFDDHCSDCGAAIYCGTYNNQRVFYVRQASDCGEECIKNYVFDCSGLLLSLGKKVANLSGTLVIGNKKWDCQEGYGLKEPISLPSENAIIKKDNPPNTRTTDHEITITQAPSGQPLQIYNTPNPFHQSTTVFFDLPSDLTATLSVYNNLGQKVFEQEGAWLKGANEMLLDLDSKNTTGIYLIKIESETITLTHKMMLVK